MSKRRTIIDIVLSTINSYKHALSLPTLVTLTNLTEAQVLRAVRLLERRRKVVRIVTWRTHPDG